MFRAFFSYIKHYDWLIVATTVLLATFGLATIYSIEASQASPSFDNFSKQLLFVGVGVTLFVGVSVLNVRTFLARGWFFYGAGITLLVLVLFFGQEIRGTTGWFVLGPYTIQPVEIAKVFLLVSLAHYFSRRSEEMASWRYLLLGGALALPYVLLVVLQPDVGSAIVMLAIFLGFLPLTRLPFRRVLTIALLFAVLAGLSWFFLRDYQRDRILTFLDPSRDPFGRGYHVTQSIIAIGSGEWFGRGLGLGPQSQLNFLPAQQTDFIFAVVAEELGLVGVTIILVTYAVLFLRLLRVIRRSSNAFEAFLVSGVFLFFLIHVLVNVGMNLGLLPVAGIPLPLVSYGGSSLLASFVALGIVEGIVVRQRLGRT